MQVGWQSQEFALSAEDVAKPQGAAGLMTRNRRYEVSPVTMPANGRAVTAAVKGLCGRRVEEERRAREALRSAPRRQ